MTTDVWPRPRRSVVELQPDEEHEEDEPDLAHRAEEREGGGRKQGMEAQGPEPAQEGRPEHDSGDHLGNDHRLTERTGDQANEARDRDDDACLNDEQNERGMEGAHCSRLGR